jgi:hypothetical protein
VDFHRGTPLLYQIFFVPAENRLVLCLIDMYTNFGYNAGMIKNFADKETEKIYNQIIVIGNPLMSSPGFPPLHTGHATFTASGVPSIVFASI